MTESTENQTPKKEPVWLVKINAFFSKSLLWNETDALIAGKIRAFAQWWLDLIRNVMVVAVLQYVARKSDKLAVKIIAEVSFPTLVVAQSVFLYQEQARSTPAGHGLWRRPWLGGHSFGH